MRYAILVGNVGRKPVVRTSKNTLYCNLSIAVHERFKHREPRTEWYDVVAFDQLAQTLVHVDVGDELLIVGTFHQIDYTGRDEVRHRSIEIRAWDIRFLRPKDRPRAAEAALAAGGLPHTAPAPSDGPPAGPPVDHPAE